MDEDESIRLHLERMFTTRQGAVSTLPDYGLPDLNDLTLSRVELARRNAKAMAECIKKYEPRLLDPEVQPMEMSDTAYTQGFSVSAQKRDAKGRLSQWKWSMVSDGSKVRRG